MAGRTIRSVFEYEPGKIILGFNETGYALLEKGAITKSIVDPVAGNTLCRGFVGIKNPTDDHPLFVLAVNKTHINLINLKTGVVKPLIED